VPLFDIYKQ